MTFDESFFENTQYFSELIKYCLKYDDIDTLRRQTIDGKYGARSSPFEWSPRHKSLDLLSFSGFFWFNSVFQTLIIKWVKF